MDTQIGGMSDLECIVDAKAELGEGVFWSVRESVAYWVDIQGKRVHRYDPSVGESKTLQLDRMIGTLIENAEGGLVAGMQDGVYALDFETGKTKHWCDPMGGDESNRLNDGKAGPDGRFYVGGIGAEGQQDLYCIDRDRSWRVVESDITCSNGLVWSLDHGKLYYIDTPTKEVVAYDFDFEEGLLRNKRTAVSIDESLGLPDGMTIDREGKLWVAHWMGSCVRRWDPDTGKILQTIPMPVEKVTCCAFGGAGLNDLYITTASVGMEDGDWEKQPQAGGLFRIRLDVGGVPGFLFKGRALVGA
ncbi:MAG: SMP-30/gluconolactonase/LRE family protein [Verrucomicrobiota bacterium]